MSCSCSNRVLFIISGVIRLVSGEYLLTRHDVSNGGTVVFTRALHVSVVIVALALALRNLLDPTRIDEFSMYELRVQLAGSGPWFGTVFAASYVALYARFASQWTYLAGVYNQIKAAELKGTGDERLLAEWKAGFIEDAADLHLIRKDMFASITKAWGNAHDGKVRQAFIEASPGGQRRFEGIMREVDDVIRRLENRMHRS